MDGVFTLQVAINTEILIEFPAPWETVFDLGGGLQFEVGGDNVVVRLPFKLEAQLVVDTAARQASVSLDTFQIGASVAASIDLTVRAGIVAGQATGVAALDLLYDRNDVSNRKATLDAVVRFNVIIGDVPLVPEGSPLPNVTVTDDNLFDAKAPVVAQHVDSLLQFKDFSPRNIIAMVGSACGTENQ